MIPSTTSAINDWIRRVALEVNPLLNGYPFEQFATAPGDPSEGFTYYDTALNAVRTWNGSAWVDYVKQDVGAAWSAATGTASRATFATYAAPTITNPPTQAEVQAVANAVQVLSQRMKALIDDLQSNGVLT